MSEKINIDKLAIEVVKQLEVYAEATTDIVKNAVENTAKLTAMDINERAAEKFDGNEYSKSWSYKRDSSLKGKWAHSMVVYAKAPYYRLAHLLEKGHAKVNGGRVAGREHIATPAQLAEETLITYIEKGIEAEK